MEHCAQVILYTLLMSERYVHLALSLSLFLFFIFIYYFHYLFFRKSVLQKLFSLPFLFWVVMLSLLNDSMYSVICSVFVLGITKMLVMVSFIISGRIRHR